MVRLPIPMSRDSFDAGGIPDRGTEVMRDQRAAVGPQEMAKKEKRFVQFSILPISTV